MLSDVMDGWMGRVVWLWQLIMIKACNDYSCQLATEIDFPRFGCTY